MKPTPSFLSCPEDPAATGTRTETILSLLASRISGIIRTEFILVLILLMFISSASAATPTKGVNASGDNLFWILLTIALTLFLALRGMLRLLLTNPAMLILFIGGLVVIYIIFTAISIVYGIGDWMDNAVQGTVNVITNIRGQ